MKFNEIEANVFATELLMPAVEVSEIITEMEGKSLDEIVKRVAETFVVSMVDATIRVTSLRNNIFFKTGSKVNPKWDGYDMSNSNS